MYRCSYTYLWRRTKQHIFIKQKRLNGRLCTDCCGQRTNGLSPDQPPTKLIFDSYFYMLLHQSDAIYTTYLPLIV